jgi:hypothetical protein
MEIEMYQIILEKNITFGFVYSQYQQGHIHILLNEK